MGEELRQAEEGGVIQAGPAAYDAQLEAEAAAESECGLVQVAAARYGVFAKHLQSVGESLDVEFVHQLRTGSRRLGEVVGLIETLMEPVAAKALDDAMRDVRRAAGDLRDLDVMEEHLEKWRFPAGLKPVREAMGAEYPEKRVALEAALRSHLQSTGFTTAMVLLARVLESHSGAGDACEEKLGKVLNKRIAKRRKGVAKAFGKAATKQTSTSFHEARIAVKKLRYSLELAQEAGRKMVGKDLKFLKNVQKLLGDMHDADVIVETLQGRVEDWSGPGAARVKTAWRGFLRKIHQRQAKRAGEFFAKSYLWANGLGEK